MNWLHNGQASTAIERERSFLVADYSFVRDWSYQISTRAYYVYDRGLAFRLRLTEVDHDDGTTSAIVDTAMKDPRRGGERLEDQIGLRDIDLARSIISVSPWVVRKYRFWHPTDNEAWVVDVFVGQNQGLAIAELEVQDIWDTPKPDWALREVTNDVEYNNEILARFPMQTPFNDPQYEEGRIVAQPRQKTRVRMTIPTCERQMLAIIAEPGDDRGPLRVAERGRLGSVLLRDRVRLSGRRV